MPKTIRDVLLDRFGVTFVPRINREVTAVPVAGAVVLRNDPSRIAFLLVNAGAFNVNLRPRGTPAAAGSIRVDANGGTAAAIWDEDGEVIAYEWTATAVGGATDVFILETRIEARPERASA